MATPQKNPQTNGNASTLTPQTTISNGQLGLTPPFTDAFKHDKPYKFLGYPELSRFMASDNDLFLFRRFGQLNARVLLNLQHDIDTLQKQLEQLDLKCANDAAEFALLNSLALGQGSGRLESAPVYQTQNIKNWLQSRSNPMAPNSGPIRDEEQQWLDEGADVICIAPQPKSTLARILEKSSLIRRVLRKRSKRGQVEYPKSVYYSDKMLCLLSDAVTVLVGLVLLYGPMWWLNYVYDDEKRLAIITCSVFVFALCLTIVGTGRPFETLAATAAYAAVLMVFMQKLN